jgi:branched-chain amino acid transport system ATP-binding protein
MSVLTLEDVHSYYGTSHILQGMNFEINAGETVALLGRNGAGKTTTMRSITGLLEPRSGRVMHQGENLAGRPAYEISRRGIKLVPEERRVFPELSVDDNMMLARRQANETTRTNEEMYELAPLLDPLRDRLAKNLSGGEQQMLAVCRALIQDPEILLLDEPSEGLAPVVVENLQEIFEDLVEEDVTILLSEQNVPFALGLTDRCYIIDKGKIVYEGTVEEIKERDDLLDEYLAVTSV